jgi:hypothetical protein
MPQRGDLEPCGPEDAEGQVRDRIQTNGRCEAAIERGDTYGPVSYLAYVPAVAIFDWSGRWDSLPAAHATSIAFDLLAVLASPRRPSLRGDAARGTARVRLGGVPVHGVHAEREHERRDHARLPGRRVLVVTPTGRAGRSSRSPAGRSSGRCSPPRLGDVPDATSVAACSGSRPLRVATVLAFSILLLEPSLWDAARTFWDRTIGFQSGRDSPFSIWGWGQYHASGIPDLGFSSPSWPSFASRSPSSRIRSRGEGPVELAALTAAVLVPSSSR